MRRLDRFDPLLLLATAVGAVFLLLLAGAAIAASSGSLDWRALASAGVAALIVATGLLYAWRLGAPGRRA